MELQNPPTFAVWLARRLSHHTARLYNRWADQFAAYLSRNEEQFEIVACDTARWEELQTRFVMTLQPDQSQTASRQKQIRAALAYYREYLQSPEQANEHLRSFSQPTIDSCRIELLGGLRVRVADRVIGRFTSGKTGALLAYLAFYAHRMHKRETLVELLWPDTSLKTGRNRLKQCLCSLRRQLEPPGTPHSSVLVATRDEIGLLGIATAIDVVDFEAALQAAIATPDLNERITGLELTAEIFRGELLVGYEEDWIVAERERLTRTFLDALRQLVAAYEQTGDLERALIVARRTVAADPLCEECHCDVMRLLASSGQVSALSQQYRKLKRLLAAELKATPSQETRECIKACRRRAKEVVRDAINRPFSTRVNEQANEVYTPQKPTPQPENDRMEPRLPPLFTRFFGREEEIAAVGKWLRTSGTRLVTLTGPGGCGKTRLALEVARRSVNDFAGAVCFIALTDLNDARLIVAAVAETLRVRASGTGGTIEQIGKTLADRSCLLVLDNFEHLVDSGSEVVRELLECVPGLLCLVTSRQRLELESEREFALAPLPIPTGPDTPERLSALSSVQLFRDRAQALRPDFQITPRNAAAVAGVCQALEGLPLAIELAAAWIQTLTPYQILERLQDRFRLLASQRKDIPPRHRTLRATVEASYRLLIPELQRFFTELSIFRGGWTLAAAEQVCQAPLATEYLAQLRIRSLITATETPDGAEMRFQMLETLREYAVEQQSPEDRKSLAARHCDYLLQFVRAAEPKLTGPDAGAWLDRLERDQENLRAALQWTLVRPEPEVGLRMAGALWRFWYVRGNPKEGATWLKDLLDIGKDVAAQVRIQAINGAGNIAYGRADYATAHAYFEEGLALRRELGDPRGIAGFLGNLANIACAERNIGIARDLFEQSLTIFRQLNDTRNIGLTLANLALTALAEENYTHACDLLQQSLIIFRTAGDLLNIVVALNNLVSIRLKMGELEQIGPLVHECLTQNEVLGNKRGLVSCLINLVSLHITQARFYCGAVLMGAIDAMREKNNIQLSLAAVAEHELHLESLRDALGSAALSAAHAEGLEMTFEEALAYARETLDVNNDASA